jgi:hypothetical protein
VPTAAACSAQRCDTRAALTACTRTHTRMHARTHAHDSLSLPFLSALMNKMPCPTRPHNSHSCERGVMTDGLICIGTSLKREAFLSACHPTHAATAASLRANLYAMLDAQGPCALVRCANAGRQATPDRPHIHPPALLCAVQLRSRVAARILSPSPPPHHPPSPRCLLLHRAVATFPGSLYSRFRPELRQMEPGGED